MPAFRRRKSYEQDGVRVVLGAQTWAEEEARVAERKEMKTSGATPEEWFAAAVRFVYLALVWGGEFPAAKDESSLGMLNALKESFAPSQFQWLHNCAFDVNGIKAAEPGEVPAAQTTASSAAA